MKKIQQKGIAQILIILSVVTVLIVGASLYLIFRNTQKTTEQTTSETMISTEDTMPNGTADNAVNAAENQLSAELIAENDALDDEDSASQIDTTLINDIEAIANEDNL